MTTRNLDALFKPRSIALIGASNRPGSVGRVLAQNLLSGGFEGRIMPVNPHETRILAAANFTAIADLPEIPDLAVIATPAAATPGVVAELAGRGCRAAVVVTAGFGEGGAAEGAALRQRLLDAARPALMRIVGPNCLGFLSPVSGINASFAQLTPARGDMALVTQSGAVATTLLDWAAGQGLGFSHVCSLGDMADVDFGDLLDYLALDPDTGSILLYVETVTAARKFMSAARIAARAKPVIVVKAGRSKAGAAAAHSHTGALAGADAVYDAAFRRAGMLRVGALRELFDAAETLAAGVTLQGDRLAILTNGGGLGVMAADALEAAGEALVPLPPALIAELDPAMPRTWSRANPVDILGDADGTRYLRALTALAGSGAFDAILMMNCPTGLGDGGAVVEAVADRLPATPPVLAAWMGAATAAPARSRLRARRIPCYETPEEAVQAFGHLAAHRRNQQLIMQVPPASAGLDPASIRTARALARAVLDDGRSLMTEPEAKALLEAVGVPVVQTLAAATPAEAGEAARRIEGPTALKILSRDITHKSDVGGVRLDLEDPAAVEAAATAMLEAVRKAAPAARIDGFTVQQMVVRPRAHELIAGLSTDPTFGPVVMFGQGGTAVEVLADSQIGLVPLDATLARDMIGRTRVARLLGGYRDRPPVDLAAVAQVLTRLSDLAVAVPEIAELDINPLVADETGVLALDARVVLRPAVADAERRFAIRPYPDALVRSLEGRGGEVVRPVRPQDAAAILAMLRASAPDDVRLVSLDPRVGLEAVAGRLSQIDYDREMTFVVDEGEAVAGVLRMVCDPNFEAAGFEVLVRTDRQRQGLGRLLVMEALHYARSRAVAYLRTRAGQPSPGLESLLRSLGGVPDLTVGGMALATGA